jgi:hypothetical protein
MFNLRKNLPITVQNRLKKIPFRILQTGSEKPLKFKCIEVASTVLYCVTGKPKLNNIFQY